MPRKRGSSTPSLPTRDQLVEFIRDERGRVDRRKIARAFGVTGANRGVLDTMLKALESGGVVDRAGAKAVRVAQKLPKVLMVEAVEIDAEAGDALCRPVEWTGGGRPPSIRIGSRKGAAVTALAPGDRALVQLHPTPSGEYAGTIIRVIQAAPEKLLGVLVRATDGLRLVPTDRKIRTEFSVPTANAGGAVAGDVVFAEVLGSRRLGLPNARVLAKVGSTGAPHAASLIALLSRDIPIDFTDATHDEVARARPAPMGEREDLRTIGLVTIDGADARDFDDAVFAEPDSDPDNPGGHHLIVAIADVSWYVRPGSALDQDARERGNSVYFPDRVVPMLPERLSNDLCSLRPHEDRPTLAVHMWFDAHGRKRRHNFTRAMIRSTARLTYEAVQAAVDGRGGDLSDELRTRTIAPLYAAYRSLSTAREARGTLDLDIEERQVIFGEDGRVAGIVPRQRYDSHKLIEEFMIAANVCAAESLEAKRLPCLYRIHDTPDPLKVDALRTVLDSMGYRLAKGQVLRPEHFMRVLEWAENSPYRHLVHALVLRSQSMAIYSPENVGHFGLALSRYAHFTSPIRRYADLLVHRALITGHGLGAGGLEPGSVAEFASVAEHISGTERRAAAAERDAVDRYVVSYMADRVGARFQGRISGVIRSGLFVTLEGIGADGFVPISTLAGDYYRHDEVHHRLTGERSGRVYGLGQAVEVRLAEAQPITGSLTFEVLDVTGPSPMRPGRGPARPGGKPRHFRH